MTQVKPPYFGYLIEQEYRSYPALSSSSVKDLSISEAHYLATLKGIKKTSKSMEIGTLVHMALFEPVQFVEKVAIIDKNLDGMPAECHQKRRAFYENKCEECFSDHSKLNGIIAAPRQMYNQVLEITQSLQNNFTLSTYLSHPDVRFEYAMIAEHNGILLKSKPDIIIPESKTILDLKTTNSLESFSTTAKKFLYHVQKAHYMNVAALLGIEIEEFLFVAVTTEAPYEIEIFDFDDELIEEGFEICRESYEKYKNLPSNFLDRSYYDFLPQKTEIRKISKAPWERKQKQFNF